MILFKYLFFVIFVSHYAAARFFFIPRDLNYVKDNNEPPAPSKKALMARYVVHNSDWVSLGTISSIPDIKGYPFVGLKSMADGPVSVGTGIPYILATDHDVSIQDLEKDNRCTMFVTLAQGNYCHEKDYDPMDPRCARVMLTGSVKKVPKNTTEYKFAKDALYARHPAMANWPPDHNFYIAKLNIIHVAVLDFFGGIAYVTPKEYFAANLTDSVNDISLSAEVILLD